MNCRSCLLISVLAFLLTAVSSGYCQLGTDTESIFLVVPEDDPQVDLAITLQNDNEQDQEIRYRIRSSVRDLDLENRMARDDRGGPDEMEYEWRDSNEDDGPVYEWYDLTDEEQFEGVEAIEAPGDDVYYGMFDIGFEFPFYGEVYEEFGIHTNGFITFVNAADVNVHYRQWPRLPTADGGGAAVPPPPTMLAANYQDLNPAWEEGGDILYWHDENMMIVSYLAVPHFDDPNSQDPWTFQIILTSDGLVKYQYNQVGHYEAGNFIHVGLQNEERDLGFTLCFNEQGYLEEELAVAFGPPDAWMNWMTIEPEEGTVQAGNSVDITLSIDAAELDPGYYYAELIIEAEGQADITIPVVMSWASPVGGISGQIVDAGTGDAIQNATTVLEEIALSDQGSCFSWEDMPVGLWDITITAPDYRPVFLQGVEVVAGEVTQLNVEMVYGLFQFLQDNEVEEQLAPDTDIEVSIRATNNGTAPVHYTTERRLIGDANRDPWEIRRTFSFGDIVDDDRIQGVTFDNGMYYVAGAAGDSTNQVYIFDSNEQLIDQFDQVGGARYGMRDLAFDGEWIWGSGELQIFAYDTDGGVQRRFDGPLNPSTTNIAWDESRGVLWCSNATSGIQALDRDGNRVGNPLSRRNLRLYGLAVYPDDPDQHTLYMIHTPSAEEGNFIYKMDPEDADTIRVTHMTPGNQPLSESLEITNGYDVYSWVVLVTANRAPNLGGDFVKVIQLDARKDWMQIEPAEGTLEAESTQDFIVTLNAAELPEADLEGEIVFLHDGRSQETVLPITLHVVLGPVQTVRQVRILQGWNIISANLQPNDPDIRTVTQSLVDAGQLILMKDAFGHFYLPSADFNSIPDWNVAQGYQIKTTEDCNLAIPGVTVLADDPMQLREGWQMISYYPRFPIEATVALSGIREHLIVAKDGFGNFYLPVRNFSNMGEMIEGRGYQIKTDAAVELIYQLGEAVAGNGNNSGLTTSHFPVTTVTGSDMSLLIETNLESGEIAVLRGDLQVGAGVIANGLCGLAVRGDDVSTDRLEGASEGDHLTLRVWDGKSEFAGALQMTVGEFVYETNDVVIGSLENEPVPTELALSGIYPNPFNARTNVSFAMPTQSVVTIGLYDQTGRKLQEVLNSTLSAGHHTIGIDGESLPSGVYFVRISTQSGSLKAKLLLLQ